MDVAWPIAAVVPTLDGPVLQVLARTTRPMTGREVHRLAGVGSENGVRAVLGRLALHGLVHATQAGRATLYVANREHLAWPAVEILTSLRRALISRVAALVRSWPQPPITAALFGSAARGDGGVDSDIDILLVHDGDGDEQQWQRQVDRLREQVSAWTGNTCQVYDLTEADYVAHLATAEPIVAEWRRDAVVVHGDPVRTVAGGHR